MIKALRIPYGSVARIVWTHLINEMRVYSLRCTLLAACSITDTFRVFEDPYNLAKITPPWLKFEVTSKNRVVMAKNTEITYRIRWLGLPMHWKTVIRDYQPPHLFIDEQTEGPYRLWQHHHTFEEKAQGTLIGDHVDYSLPFGPLGGLAHAVMVRQQLLCIFEYRQKEIGKLLNAQTTEVLRPVVTPRA
jgi:ligand-binding SRPBCC domain-containing protein